MERIPLDVPPLDQSRGHGMRIQIDNDPASDGRVRDGRLVTLLVKARIAQRQLFDPASTLTSGAERDHLTRTARLAYLAPDIVAAILDGTQPRTLNARKLMRIAQLPHDWQRQRLMFGMTSAV